MKDLQYNVLQLMNLFKGSSFRSFFSSINLFSCLYYKNKIIKKKKKKKKKERERERGSNYR